MGNCVQDCFWFSFLILVLKPGFPLKRHWLKSVNWLIGQFSHMHTVSNMQWRLGDLLQNPGIVFLCNSLHFSIPLYQCDHTGHHGLKFNLNIILSHILSTFSCSKWKYKSIFCPEPLIFLFIYFFWMRWHIPLTTNWEGHCFIINATLE